MFPRPLRLALLAVSALVALAIPASASAGTFYVAKNGGGSACSQAAPCDTIAKALSASVALSGTGDRIEVGPGLYVEGVVIESAELSGLTVHGAGRGPDQEGPPPSATVLRTPGSGTNALTASKVAGGVTIEDLRLEAQAGYVNAITLELEGTGDTARDIDVHNAGANANTDGIILEGDEDLMDHVRVRQTGQARGIATFGARDSIVDSEVFSAGGQAIDSESYGETKVERSLLEAGANGTVVTSTGKGVDIDSSLITGGTMGLEQYSGFEEGLSTLTNVTIDVAEPKDGEQGTGVEARAETNAEATVKLLNSIVLEPQGTGNGAGYQTVVCEDSDAPTQTTSAGKSSISCNAAGGNASPTTASLFAPGGWKLLAGSQAIDSGAGIGTSATDLAGAPRVVDGNGDGIARIDRGAYEFQPAPPRTADTVAPVLSGVSITHRRFRVKGGKVGHRSSKKGHARPPAGTRFRYSLSEDATVTVAIERRLPVARASVRNRYATLGRISARSRAGAGGIAFAGRIHGKRIPAGVYRATLRATDAAGNVSGPVQLNFIVVP